MCIMYVRVCAQAKLLMLQNMEQGKVYTVACVVGVLKTHIVSKFIIHF